MQEELEQLKETLQKEVHCVRILQRSNVDRAMQQKNESEEVFSQSHEGTAADGSAGRRNPCRSRQALRRNWNIPEQRETEIQHANEAFQKDA